MNIMNIKTKKWESDLVQMAGGPELELKLGLEPVPTKTEVGLVSQYLSKRYGFSPSCAVTAFMGDNPAAMAGTRAGPGDVVVRCYGDERGDCGGNCVKLSMLYTHVCVVVKSECSYSCSTCCDAYTLFS